MEEPPWDWDGVGDVEYFIAFGFVVCGGRMCVQ